MDKLQIDIILQIGMAAQNLSGDGQQKAVRDLICSPDLTPGLRGQLTFLSVLNTFTSVTAFLGNALILIAPHKVSSLHPPSELLLRSLATTDLCVGVISLPLFVTYWISVANKHWNMFRYASAVGFQSAIIFGRVSVFTLTAMSVDRLLAQLLELRYRQIVTLKRTYVIVIAIWVMCTINSAMQFWNSLITLWCGIIATSLCLAISVFSYYAKIFLTLPHQQNQVHGHVQQPNQTNSTEHSAIQKGSVHCNMAATGAGRLLSTLIYIVAVLTSYCGLSSSLCYAWIYTVILVFLNSSLNPILYGWKLEEVRQQS